MFSNAGVVLGVVSAAPGDDFQLNRGLGWLALALPLLAFTVGVVARSLTAEDRVRRQCDEEANAVRDCVMSLEVRPTLGRIIVAIHPYVPWPADPASFLPGEPGDPEVEAIRILGYRAATFSEPLSRLEAHYIKVHSARCVHERRVGHEHRIGLAMALFFLPCAYLSLWLCMPSVPLPDPLTLTMLTAGAATCGWAGAEWLASGRETNALSTLAREARATSGGLTQ